MRSSLYVLAVFCVASTQGQILQTQNEVACESFGSFYALSELCCHMDVQTKIKTQEVTISSPKNKSIDGLVFFGNRNIEYLPVSIYKKYPKLLQLYAEDCSIKQVSRQNFEKLKKLEGLHLNGNQLEKLESGTFDDLVNLVAFCLGNNKLKSIESRTFEKLTSLNAMSLLANECMDQDAYGAYQMKALMETMNKKCVKSDKIPIITVSAIKTTEFKKLLDVNCGAMSYLARRIIGGTVAERGRWPFVVALQEISSKQFFCGGTLITTKHVLTAAHCIQDKYVEKRLEAENIRVLLGRHSLKDNSEKGSLTRDVETIIVHPEWKFNFLKYDADLAILVLDHAVVFSTFIQPACLTKEPELQNENFGTVVGWGKSEGLSKHEDVPRRVSIKAVNDSVCFEKDHELGAIYSSRSFCAGGEGAGPCLGDSGGGFFVEYRGLWTLRGIVSAAARRSTGDCDVNRFTLYTKTLDFADWIKTTVEENFYGHFT